MPLDPSFRFNLKKTIILLFDPTPMGRTILTQILTGFGASRIHACKTIEEAKQLVGQTSVDLMIVDVTQGLSEGYEFVRWLRKGVPEPNRHTPVLLTAAHLRPSDVARARDAGSHFIVAKPLAPSVLLERIIWVGREGRAFLLSDDYVGPDRRFAKGRPGRPRRRRDDPLPELTDLAPTERPVVYID
jgi:CheY-like chemotaxis protein